MDEMDSVFLKINQKSKLIDKQIEQFEELKSKNLPKKLQKSESKSITKEFKKESKEIDKIKN